MAKISKSGYKRNSKDKNEPALVIPSNNITMKGVDFPVYGVDNTGYSQMMYPGGEYQFPGNMVYEIPMAQDGIEMPFGLPLRSANPSTPYAYESPVANGYLLPDPNRPELLNTGATEYKMGVGDVVIPTVVNGNYMSPDDAYARYLITGEQFIPTANPESYSRFYDTISQLGLMKQQRGGDSSIPDLSNRGWLSKYQNGGSEPIRTRAYSDELEYNRASKDYLDSLNTYHEAMIANKVLTKYLLDPRLSTKFDPMYPLSGTKGFGSDYNSLKTIKDNIFAATILNSYVPIGQTFTRHLHHNPGLDPSKPRTYRKNSERITFSLYDPIHPKEKPVYTIPLKEEELIQPEIATIINREPEINSINLKQNTFPVPEAELEKSNVQIPSTRSFPIMKAAQDTRTGQYRVGTNYWDPKTKSWKQHYMHPETQRENYEEVRIPEMRTIVAPPSFQKGGWLDKYQDKGQVSREKQQGPRIEYLKEESTPQFIPTPNLGPTAEQKKIIERAGKIYDSAQQKPVVKKETKTYNAQELRTVEKPIAIKESTEISSFNQTVNTVLQKQDDWETYKKDFPKKSKAVFPSFSEEISSYQTPEEKRDRELIGDYYKQYKPETASDVKTLQQMLIDKGYLDNKKNTKGEFKELDGKFGDRTRLAYEKYLSEKHSPKPSLDLSNELTRTECGLEGCAEYVSSVTRPYNWVLGDAWTMNDRINRSGGKTKYNIYTDPAFRNIQNTNDLIRITKKVKETNKAKANQFAVGDVVGLFNPMSTYHNVARKEGKGTYNTHVGIVTAIENGVPIISHNIKGTLHHDPYNKLNIGWISEPNYAAAKTYIPSAEGKTVEEKVNIYSQDLTQLFAPELESSNVAAIVKGILTKESGLGTVETTHQSIRPAIRAFRGESNLPEDVSRGIGKLKTSSLPTEIKTFLQIPDAGELSDDAGIKGAIYKFIEGYKYFDDYKKKNPELKLTDQDVENMAILSYNQGYKRLSNLGWNNPRMFPEEEIESLRNLYEGNIKDLSSTNLKYLPFDVGETIYDLRYPEGHPTYISKVREYSEKKHGGWLDKYQYAGQTGSKSGPWIANLPKEEFKPKPNIPVYEDPIKKGYVAKQVPGVYGSMKTVYVNPKNQDVIETPEETRKQMAMNEIARSNNIDPIGVGILAASGAAPLARTVGAALPFLDAPLTIGSTVVPGVTANSILGAAGAGYSTAQVLDPNSELRTNPNAENILTTGLGFVGLPYKTAALSFADDLSQAGKFLGSESIKPSYIADLAYSIPKGKLPTYKTASRWQADKTPEFLEEASKKLTDEQKALEGSWYGYFADESPDPLHSLGFYPATRKGPGTFFTLRLSDRQIANLERTMPASAKGMSGKMQVVDSANDYFKGELIIPESLRSKAKKFDFNYNPSDLGPELYKNTELYNMLTTPDVQSYGRKYLTGKYLDEVILQPLNKDITLGITSIPRKYLPFKYGGWLDMYQDGRQVGPRIANLPPQQPTPNIPVHPVLQGYKPKSVPGTLGSMTTVYENPKTKAVTQLPKDVEKQQASMDMRGDADRVFFDFNPLTATGSGAFYGLSNIAQGNVLEGALELGLTAPITPRVISGVRRDAPKQLPGSNNVDELVDLWRIQERGARPMSELAAEGKLGKMFQNEKAIQHFKDREKYFGQWFTKDKADFDFYRADREFLDPEIIQLQVPKSRLAEFQNYDKSLSRAADREFVIPFEQQKLFTPKTLPGSPNIQDLKKRVIYPQPSRPISDYTESYLGKSKRPISRREQVERSFLSPEAQAKANADDWIYYDSQGNIIPRDQYPGRIEYKYGGWLDNYK